MSKKVLILSSSPRRNGNSDLLCNEFMRGAAEAGHQVEKIFLNDKPSMHEAYEMGKKV
ncbi:hypothetical protein JCM16496A_15850 [Bacteroides rodentium JCM 16496]